MPSVSFVVVNFNGGSLLRQCLASIQAQTYDDFEIIVVDNGSSDTSCAEAERVFPGIRVLRLPTNLGFAEANNRALQMAQGTLIALVNNDATLDPGWTEAMLAGLQCHRTAGAAAGCTLQAHDTGRIDSAGFAFYSCGSTVSWRGTPADTLVGARHAPFGPVAAAAVYRRSAIERVGFFRAEYFCYYEDTDLAIRLLLWGYPTIYVPEAIAYHVGSHTGRDDSDFKLYHLRRNVEYMYWVDMLGPLAWVNLPLHIMYESLALAGALWSGQARVLLKAKRDAWSKRRWILNARKELQAELRAHGKMAEAQVTLWRAMRLGLPVAERTLAIRARKRRRA